jgi:hypothetical protein
MNFIQDKDGEYLVNLDLVRCVYVTLTHDNKFALRGENSDADGCYSQFGVFDTKEEALTWAKAHIPFSDYSNPNNDIPF